MAAAGIGCKVHIFYFLNSHNTSFLPPKILHNKCFRFLLGHEDVSG